MELLEYLASRSGCVYLSDLKFLPADKQNFPFLREVSLEYFPEKNGGKQFGTFTGSRWILLHRQKCC